MIITADQLSLREKKLLSVSRALKKYFIGVDNVIDQFIQQVRPWYLTPTLMDRPTIINLWGMTGVGKTDLVRRFIKLLDFQDRSLEIELSNSERSAYFQYETSISGILHRNRLFDEQPSILFFDEIQHFRTIDESGHEVTNGRFQDFWELLSDGQLSRRDMAADFEEMMTDLLADEIRRSREESDTKSENKRIDTALHPWNIRKIRQILGVTDDLSTASLLSMTSEKAIQLLNDSKSSKKMFETIKMYQSLIIISGNLDSLYTMSGLASEAEVDANIFHDQTSKLNIVDVKHVLRERFRPEHISRLGNTHILYPSLSRENYTTLIERKLRNIETRVVEQAGITLKFDDSILALIYRNGVFPTQGVRPVFSAISEIITTRLHDWILYCTQHSADTCTIAYDSSERQFYARLGTSDVPDFTQSFHASLDQVRANKSKDEQALVAVHEAGHAVAYAVLFGLAPLQLKSRLASATVGGFTFPHKIELTRENCLSQLQILMSGMVAEELVYGGAQTSAGHESDLNQATRLASRAVRQLNFSSMTGVIVAETNAEASSLNTNIKKSNQLIEDMIAAATNQAKELLSAHLTLLRAVATELFAHGLLEPTEFISLCAKHQVACEQHSESWVAIADYTKSLKNEDG